MNKKYEFTGKTIKHFGKTLRQIKRVDNGLIGGYIQYEGNLSHEGTCFVHENAKVYGGVVVYGSARVYGEAKVYGNAVVYGNVKVKSRHCVQNITSSRHNITITKEHAMFGCKIIKWGNFKEEATKIGTQKGLCKKEIKMLIKQAKLSLKYIKFMEGKNGK